MSVTETILDTLKTLPRGEVDDVRKQINAYLSFGVWGDSDGVSEVDENTSAGRRVFRVVAEEMQAAGLADMKAVSFFRLRNRRDFSAKAERLVKFLREQHKDRQVQDGILRIGVQLLIKYFRRYAEQNDNVVITTEMIVRNIAKIPARLDREFPGYGACGMLHLLIKIS